MFFVETTKTKVNFYHGQVVVDVHDAVFDPSSAQRHSALMVNQIKQQFSGNIKPIFTLFTDRGPDHNVTFTSVKLSLIAAALQVDLDALIALRVCPGYSFHNPCEQVCYCIPFSISFAGLFWLSRHYLFSLLECGVLQWHEKLVANNLNQT